MIIRSSILMLVLLACVVLVSFAVPRAFAEEGALGAGQSSFAAAQYEDALKHFDASVDAQPTNAEAHFWRAKCLAAMGRIKEAGGEYRMAMMLTKDKTIKDECQSQLKQFNQPIPAESIGDAKKKFQLETRKLDWNLGADRSGPLNASLKGQDDDLAALINGGVPRFAGGVPIEPRNIGAELQDGPAHAVAIDAVDRAQLIRSDVVIILDHSGSMGAGDCPKSDDTGHPGPHAQPRLAWAAEEMQNFSRQLLAQLPHGFTFITFDTRPDMYEIRSAPQFESILQSLQSGGGTTLAPALELAFAHHRAHLNQPLLVAIVSDCQIDVGASVHEMISATHRFPLPNGAFFTFLQVGILAEERARPVGPWSKPDLLTHLVERGAAYEPATLIPFSKLRKTGLANGILVALRSAQAAPRPASSIRKKIK